jgi:hypothetical protein
MTLLNERMANYLTLLAHFWAFSYAHKSISDFFGGHGWKFIDLGFLRSGLSTVNRSIWYWSTQWAIYKKTLQIFIYSWITK